MIYSVIKPLRSIVSCGALRYRFTTSNAYVPIRPLKQNRNVLFSVGPPTPVATHIRLGLRLPFLGLLLEGLTNAFTWPIIGGMFFSLIFASWSLRILRFVKSHEVFELAVNKNLTKFQLVIPSNTVTRGWEDALLKARGTSFEAIFKQKLRTNTIQLYPDTVEQCLKMDQPSLKKIIRNYRYQRQSITLELDRNQIESIKMESFSHIKHRVIDRYSRKKTINYFEHYSTEKTQKDFLTITTRRIEGEPLYFYLAVKQNYENKYDEYIKALAEGKTIVNI